MTDESHDPAPQPIQPEQSDPTQCSGEPGPCLEYGHHAESLKQPAYPHPDGDTIVLGPELFALADRTAIAWEGEWYLKAAPVDQVGVLAECDAIEADYRDQHDDVAVGARAAVMRVRAHAAPPEPADQNLRDRIDGAVHARLDDRLGKGDWTGLRVAIADAVLAVLPAPADRPVLRERIAVAIARYDWNAGLSGTNAIRPHHYGEAGAVLAVLVAPVDRAADRGVAAAIVAALQERAGELSDLAEEQMRPSLEERAQEWREAASVARRMVDEAQQAPPAVNRRDVQTVLAETVAVYAADRLGVSVADVLDAAADASAAERAPARPAGWAQGREWKADLLHQQARELRAADETQQAGEAGA
jgi:hypothetical protein